jgi:hypothetical protein
MQKRTSSKVRSWELRVGVRIAALRAACLVDDTGHASLLLHVSILFERQAVLIAGVKHPAQAAVIVGPGLAAFPSGLQEQVEAIDPGIQVVEVMQGDGLERLGSAGGGVGSQDLSGGADGSR